MILDSKLPSTLKTPTNMSESKVIMGERPTPRHYDMVIQPEDFIAANSLDWFEGNVIKYVARFSSLHNISDLDNIISMAERMKKLHSENYYTRK